MQWLSVTIQTASSGVELLAANLTLWGFDSFVVTDQEEFEDFLADNTAYWDYVDESLSKKMAGCSQITLYLEDNEAAPQTLHHLRQQLQALKASYPDADFGSLQISINDVPDEDWANSWRKNYQPVAVGERLLIVPSWLSTDGTDGRVALRLEPGLTFGTGTHPTTQLCLQALQELVHGGERVIDLGSGSGILSIASLLLGASTAVGVDIDPKAEDIARENAALNELGNNRFNALTADLLTQPEVVEKLAQDGFDLVCANIVADVIISIIHLVPGLLRKSGIFICSGILDSRVEEVEAAIRASGLVVLERRQMAEWCMCRAALPQQEEF